MRSRHINVKISVHIRYKRFEFWVIKAIDWELHGFLDRMAGSICISGLLASLGW